MNLFKFLGTGAVTGLTANPEKTSELIGNKKKQSPEERFSKLAAADRKRQRKQAKRIGEANKE